MAERSGSSPGSDGPAPVRPSSELAAGAIVEDPMEIVGLPVVAVGIDLVDIDRIRTIVARQKGFVERVYHPSEQAYCERLKDPAERYAARFAAKEAVLKALGTGLGGADFTDIEVVKADSGAPFLRLHGRASLKAAELGIVSWLITLTHSQHLAQALVVGLGGPKDQ